ncbi:MAG TPA: ankyrin repeat domain-containing protein [Candidatus Saccharimonadales bacterium]|nr:ankyrin repeat domain-containing protein [Candidatus Saccharimonadales bacterium]
MQELDRAGRTELHYAALHNEAEKMEQLITDGCDPNLPDKQGMTPLHFAAQSKSFDALKLLLELGVSFDSEDWQGNTPLWAAYNMKSDNGKSLKLIFSYGADPYHENKNGMSPIKLAEVTGNKTLKDILLGKAK